MATKPGIMDLAREARIFVAANQKMVWHYAMPVIGPILVCNLLGSVGIIYSKFFAVFPLLTIYFAGAFILAWHRAVLLGVKPQHAVNPFLLKPGEGKFLGYVIGIAFVPFLFGIAGGIPVGIGIGIRNKLVIIVGALLLTALLFYSIILSLRFAFILPARSVNVPLTFRESKPVSRGLLWTFFAASFIAIILPALLIVVIRVIASLLVINVLRFPMDSVTGAFLIFLLGAVPAIIINFIIYARYVTVLSRLYQWSVQNRPLPATTGHPA